MDAFTELSEETDLFAVEKGIDRSYGLLLELGFHSCSYKIGACFESVLGLSSFVFIFDMNVKAGYERNLFSQTR